MPALADSAPGLGLADLATCLATLRRLGIACGTSGQPDRAGPLLDAAAVLRDLLAQLEAPGRLGRPRFVALEAAQRTVGRSRPALNDVSPHGRSRPLLSPREREVLSLLAQGCSNAAIADALGIGRRTAETHVAHILGKFGVASRTAALAYASRHGLLA
jgi:DNA-binding NarL/FixJ family response regulator